MSKNVIKYSLCPTIPIFCNTFEGFRDFTKLILMMMPTMLMWIARRSSRSRAIAIPAHCPGRTRQHSGFSFVWLVRVRQRGSLFWFFSFWRWLVDQVLYTVSYLL